jgi:Kef-type K+ transport system membrane component KefB
VGAYLVGVAAAQSLDDKVGNEANVIIHQFALSFFAPLYFVSIGLQANFLTSFNLPLVAVIIAIACLGKIFGAALGARLGGLARGEAWAVGLGLNARGAMEIILASVALQTGLVSPAVFVALVAMAVVTSMLAGPSMQRLLQGRAVPALVTNTRPTAPYD